jgi:uroporphyrinogen III methyltransferase/synthase
MSNDATSREESTRGSGLVYLVGGGPGDPMLVTIRGLDLLRHADVVVYDALSPPRLLEEANASAELIDAGKRAGSHKMTQAEINEVLLDRAQRGLTVVRLKGGDPYVFGRGGEEALFLAKHGIEVEVVPGVTAGVAVPAYAGIPVTHRHVAASCTMVTAHEAPDAEEGGSLNYQALADLAASGGTLCIYMGMARLDQVCQRLIRCGLSPTTPAAAIQWGTTPQQKSIFADVSSLAERCDQRGLGAPAIVVIGRAVTVSPELLNWYERQPLLGTTIAITRSRAQAGQLGAMLAQLGANVIEAPIIEVLEPDDWEPLVLALAQAQQYDWIVVTSVNGVASMTLVVDALGLDSRHFFGVSIAAVGQATADALWEMMRLRADLVPRQYTGDKLARAITADSEIAGQRVLLLRTDIGSPDLPTRLAEAGAQVDEAIVYRTRQAESLPAEFISAMQIGEVDWITFTSSSTARGFATLFGRPDVWPADLRVASIGPVTSKTCREVGLPVDVEASPHTLEGLVEAILQAQVAGTGDIDQSSSDEKDTDDEELPDE